MEGITHHWTERVDYARHPTRQELDIPDISRDQLMQELARYIKGQITYQHDDIVSNGTNWQYQLNMGITINTKHFVFESFIDIEDDGPSPARSAVAHLYGGDGNKLLYRDWKDGERARIEQLVATFGEDDIPVRLSWPDDPGVIVHLGMTPAVLVVVLLAVIGPSLKKAANFGFAGSDDPSELLLNDNRRKRLRQAFQFMHSSLEDEINEFYVPVDDGGDVPMSSMATKFLEHI